MTSHPTAARKYGARNPSCFAAIPPISAPIGWEPQATIRTALATLPLNSSGVSFWRTVILITDNDVTPNPSPNMATAAGAGLGNRTNTNDMAA